MELARWVPQPPRPTDSPSQGLEVRLVQSQGQSWELAAVRCWMGCQRLLAQELQRRPLGGVAMSWTGFAQGQLWWLVKRAQWPTEQVSVQVQAEQQRTHRGAAAQEREQRA